ncbi:MAG: hypothetical protein HDS11_02600 [Bacteroides sp.]|nr:hypothetical protein [Bacteroides sp.]
MKVEDIRNHKDFLMFLAQGTAEEMAKKYNLKFEQAWNIFKKSDTFQSLINADDKYDQDMPKDILDLWENEKLFGFNVDSEARAYGILEGQRLK